MPANRPRPETAVRAAVHVPIVAMVVVMLALVVAITMFRGERPGAAAVVSTIAESPLAEAPAPAVAVESAAAAAPAGTFDNLADARPEATPTPLAIPEASPTPEPTATPLPLAATPVPTIAAAVPPTATPVPEVIEPTPIPPAALVAQASLNGREAGAAPASDPATPADPNQPGEPATPAEPAQDTADEADTAAGAEPATPADPNDPGEPATPADPAEPAPNPQPRADGANTTVLTPTPAPTSTPAPTVDPRAASVSPSGSTAELETWVFGQVNQVRTNAGLPPLVWDSGIAAVSRDWSARMAAAGGISHRPQAELSRMLPPGWRSWGENVAMGPDVRWAQSGLEQSQGHYDNMVGAFTHIGIGVHVIGDVVFVTQNFARYPG